MSYMTDGKKQEIRDAVAAFAKARSIFIDWATAERDAMEVAADAVTDIEDEDADLENAVSALSNIIDGEENSGLEDELQSLLEMSA
jgi:hypothetical protein